MKCIFCMALVCQSLIATAAMAMPIKTQLLKPRAYFQETEGNLLEPLDLKSKTLSFKKADFDQCGLSLMRQSSTMNYSCTLTIPGKSRISRLQNIVTPKQVEIEFGNSKRKVFVDVSADARTLTFMTGFDATGIDFEVSKFNDDFFKVYDKVAQLVISEAFAKQPVRIEVLESNEIKTAPEGKRMFKAVVKADSKGSTKISN